MDVSITGARILYEFPIEVPILGRFAITETLVVSWLVLLIISCLCIWLTHDLRVENVSKRQAVAEYLVEMAEKFVVGNMGEKFRYFIPFIGALLTTAMVSNLIGLIGLRSPTTDLSTEAAWSCVVLVLIVKQNIKSSGLGGYLKGFLDPIPIFAPFNVLGEVAKPVAMAFRHFGNMLSGFVVTTLLYTALAIASSALFGLIPGAVGDVLSQIPFLDVGIPAVLSVYFDWVSGVLQAYIYCMLTIMFIANADGE